MMVMTGAEKFWRTERDADGVEFWIFDTPDARVNVLSKAALKELEGLIAAAEAAPPKGIIIRSGKEKGFIAGADVNEFLQMNASIDVVREHIHWTQSVFDRLERLPCKTVSAIDGFCLGGGLEMALACDYRVAVDEPHTRIGLPEVRLGIHPGYGGAARLPGRVGHLAAMDMMLSGRALSARAAKRIGLVDQAVPLRQLLRTAKTMVTQAPAARAPVWWQRLAGNALLRPLVGLSLRKTVAKRVRKEHYPAPYALIDLWQRDAGNRARTLSGEADSVAELLAGDTSKNLLRVFFLQERLKAQGRGSGFKAGHVHVIGAGVMGGDIAAWCALRGLAVTLQDQSPERIAPAIGRARSLFVKKLKLPRLAQAAMDRLIPDVRGLGVPKADVVIEAIFENLEAKQALLKGIEPRLKPSALMATNTSSIPLEEIAEALDEPQRLVGLHFFNPVAKMQLVEIVRSRFNTDETIANATCFTRQIDRLPLPVKSSPGFLVNRILMPYLIEAVRLEEEGVQAEAIDRAALEFGMPMGPIELADVVGLDVCLSVAEILSKAMGTKVPDRLRSMVAAGTLGHKSGHGFYRYRKGKAIKGKYDKDMFVPDDLCDRLMLSMLNEAVACLREGVVDDADLLDAGIIFGTGFAPFRGGPMHHIRQSGVSALRARLDALSETYGERFGADQGWSELDKEG